MVKYNAMVPKQVQAEAAERWQSANFGSQKVCLVCSPVRRPRQEKYLFTFQRESFHVKTHCRLRTRKVPVKKTPTTSSSPLLPFFSLPLAPLSPLCLATTANHDEFPPPPRPPPLHDPTIRHHRIHRTHDPQLQPPPRNTLRRRPRQIRDGSRSHGRVRGYRRSRPDCGRVEGWHVDD